MFEISWIISKWSSQIGRSSSGILSSQSSCRMESSWRSSLRFATMGMILPVWSKTSPTLEAQCRLVSRSGMMLLDLVDFFLRFFFAKFSSELLMPISSDFGCHTIPGTPIVLPSSDRCSGGSDPEKVTPLRLKSSWPRTNLISLAFSWASDSVGAPVTQSSTKTSSWRVRLTSGYWSLNNDAIDRREVSAWLPLGRIP